jgi:hypothetical protein
LSKPRLFYKFKKPGSQKYLGQKDELLGERGVGVEKRIYGGSAVVMDLQ